MGLSDGFFCYPLTRQIESPRPARRTVAESGLIT